MKNETPEEYLQRLRRRQRRIDAVESVVTTAFWVVLGLAGLCAELYREWLIWTQ